MAKIGISRRDVLRSLAVGATTGSVLTMIPAQAAEFAHNLVQKEKASAAGKYAPNERANLFGPQPERRRPVELPVTMADVESAVEAAIAANTPLVAINLAATIARLRPATRL